MGRCIFNLMLLGEINGSQAVRILGVVKLGDVVGATSANMRAIVGKARKTVTAKNDYKNYPFLPVFWMIPNNLVKDEFEKRADHLKALETEYNQQTALITRKSNVEQPGKKSGNGPPGKNVIRRIQPIEALHQLAFKTKAFSERYFSFKAEHLELAGYNTYHNVLKSIIEYDENAEQDINVNELFNQFDLLTEFIIDMDIEYPDMGIAKRFRDHLKRKSDGTE